MKRRWIAAGTAMAMLLGTVAAAMPGFAPPRWQFRHKWSEIAQLPRHRHVRESGVPQPFAAMQSPLRRTRATVQRGAAIYARNCLSCHGPTGEGDGEEGLRLTPRPGDLAWLSEMKESRSDGFMYWTIAEGGVPFASAMPAYKDRLTPDEIWAVSAYIQVHLPVMR